MSSSSLPRAAAEPAPSPVAPRRRRWPPWLGRLELKLFAAIAGTNALLAAIVYAVFSTSFDQGFFEYLRRADEQRLAPLAARLVEAHGRPEGWAPLARDPDAWVEFTRSSLGLPPRRAAGAEPAEPPAGAPPPPVTIGPRLVLLDASGAQVAGRADPGGPAPVRLPLDSGGQRIGYLGYFPRTHLAQTIESAFAAQLHRRFEVVGLGMLLSALVLGWGLSRWITRRVRVVAEGTRRLASGDYAVRLPQRSHDELDRLAADFNALAETLTEARAARQRWIADIAHELRTPLAVLRGEIEALQDGVRPLDAAALASLAQETAQLARLVEDLRLLSESDAGALTYRREPLDWSELVDDALDGHARALAEHGIALRVELAPGVRVRGDAGRLAQVLGNLMQNTLRYTDRPGALEVRLRRAGDRAVLDWQDSSPGVPPQDLPRLGERLFRVERSRSRSAGGRGLGLSIARAIVEAHGGRLEAHASRLGGLRIEVALPAIDAAEALR